MAQNQSGFKKFPKGFLFGSATSAHQIEGGNFNSDWYAWEKAGNTADKLTSHPAANSWHKWREDINLLKLTHQNAYRFSIEWAKIEPAEGQFDETAIDHYRQILQELRKNNITAMITLHHFTLPLWLDKKGGFINSKSVFYFTRYAQKMAEEFKDLVDLWATFNEPKVLILKGYIQGEWPPNKRNIFRAIAVWYNLKKAHIDAYRVMKKIVTSPIGIVENISAYEKANDNFLTNLMIRIARYFDTTIFVKPIIKSADFLGINFYMKFVIDGFRHYMPQNAPQNDFGWAINQEGLYQVIKENSRWGKPIYITENGLADEHDKYRGKFIEDALDNILKSISDGADVRGYFYWSLLDNFEWASGYTMKFGLADINRKLRPSAFRYADLIKKHSSD